ncbi:zinc-binding alcohol dehydrogenase family protein [Siculibacillus lacustris]|uniref:Zinc-binding alcohol dehydrogenase family protein n=1 Tax=Siculibacillus lacustris TaxID=1549641 RepID=A0A4Q9VEX9_9HYPH|nr:zinc-binding alcohol dehydrogenase family protein [Siculibacillus lacustris]TBW32796.1 zinc-binding alcohol dehydrogenase family protein [Siculibacillus lacustris]
MKALMIEGVERCAFHDVPEPVPGPGEVLVAVRHVGLCGSDLATFTGLNPLVALPRIPGHEIGAEIICTGTDVPAEYAPGRRAIVVPYTACGQCTSCRQGRVNACKSNRTLGVQQNGGLAEKFVLPWGKLILNDKLAPRHLALVEPLSVGFHAVARGRVTKTDRVVVIGCGMIGMGAIAGAVARGATVIAVDIGASKIAMAARYGATHTIDAGTEDVAARVAELTGGDGADVVIEAVGAPATFTQAIDIVCFCGRVVYIGYCKAPVAYDTKFFNLKELDIMGSRNATADDFRAVITYLEGLDHAPDDLISKVFAFEDAAEALPYWTRERATTLKIVIER